MLAVKAASAFCFVGWGLLEEDLRGRGGGLGFIGGAVFWLKSGRRAGVGVPDRVGLGELFRGDGVDSGVEQGDGLRDWFGV